MTKAQQILYVASHDSDSEMVLEALGSQLDGLEILVAESAEAGLAQLSDETVQCIISEHHLPETDGLSFLEAANNRAVTSPLFLVTTDLSDDLISDALAQGVTDVFQRDALKDQRELVAHRIQSAIDAAQAQFSYREVFEKSDAAMVIRDLETGEVLDVNQQYCDLIGYPYDAAIELSLADITADLPGYTAKKAHEMIDTAVAEGSHQFEWPEQTQAGAVRWVNVSLSVVELEGQERILVTVRDIHDRKQREQRLEALHATICTAVSATTPEEVCEHAIGAVRDLLGIDANAVHLYDSGENALKPVAVTDTARELVGELPTFTPGNSIAWRVYETGTPTIVDDVRGDPDVYNDATPIQSELHLPLGKHGILIGGSTSRNAFDPADRSFGEILANSIKTVLTNAVREERIQQLQARTQEVMRAKTKEEIATVAVEAAEEVLSLPLNGVHLLAEDGDTLRPAAVSETVATQFDRPPTYDRSTEEGIADKTVWDVFETGQMLAISNPDECQLFSEYDGPARSGIIYPLGDHGVFITSSLHDDGFDETDQALGKVLAATLLAALDRAEREARIRERERQLEREVDRLDQVARIISHDLRNPLNIADGYLTQVQEDHESEQLSEIEHALDRAIEITNNVLTLTRDGGAVERTQILSLATVADNCWRNVVTDVATITIEEDLQLHADATRLRHLLENLFRNAVEHGGSTVTVRIGALEDDSGFYVEDDGPGIPSDVRENLFHSENSGENSGFGCMIVERMAGAHGWEVSVTEGADGGARFEITGVDTIA